MVIDRRTAVKTSIRVAIYRSSGVTVSPTVEDVALVLTSVVDPRFLLVGQVLHCVTVKPATSVQFIHSGCFYSASTSSLLLRGAPDYSIDAVSKLTVNS